MCVLLVVGCSSSYQVAQVVEGRLTSERGVPVAGLPVSVIRSTEPGACNNATVLGMTDKDGHFSVSRQATVGRIAVIVQHDTLCVLEGGRWTPIWRSVYGPASDKQTFACSRGNNGWNCIMDGLTSMHVGLTVRSTGRPDDGPSAKPWAAG
jgi:hypothetical protein